MDIKKVFSLIGCGMITSFCASGIKTKQKESGLGSSTTPKLQLNFDKEMKSVAKSAEVIVMSENGQEEFLKEKVGLTTLKKQIPLSFGKYKMRVKYLDSDDKIIYDSDICDKTKDVESVDFTENQQEMNTIACKVDDPDFNLEAMRSERDRLINSDFSGPGWPDRPRKGMNIDKSITNTSTIEVSLGGDVWGLGASLDTNVSVGISFKSGLTLVKHAASGETKLVNSEGSLAYEEGVGFVALCTYSASATNGISGTAKVKANPKIPLIGIGLGGVSAANQTKSDTVLSVDGSSKFFTIRPNETIAIIKDRCKDIFQKEYSAGVREDLKDLVKAHLQIENRDNSEKVLDRALHGPTEVLEANGARWRVEQVKTEPKDNLFIVSGVISRERKEKKLLVIKKTVYDPIFYTLTYDDTGEITASSFKNKGIGGVDKNLGEDWVKKGVDIIHDIGIQAWAKLRG